MLMSVSTALRAAKILGFWNLKRFVIDKNGGTLYLHCIIFLIPTLPNYVGVSDNGINLTAPRHQIYQVKLTFVPFSGPESADSAYERGGDACQKFWITPLKETDLGVAQAFFDP